MSSIKKKFISGVLWESFGRFTTLGIQFIVTILIARFLSPSDFGIIGLLTVFISLGQILLDSGFSQALIQKKDADNNDFSSVFFLNVIIATFLYLLLFIISPYIAAFYKFSDLKDYARVLFLIIPINSFGLIQNVIIQKELNFKITATANLLSAIFSGLVGVVMAYLGYGIWALVWQQISMNASKTLLYILKRRWIPIFTISISAIEKMFTFSMNLMLHSLVNVIMKNIYILVIGKYFPIVQVGYFTQADKLQEISGSTISQIIIKVSFPALIQKRDNANLLKEAYAKIFATSMYFVTPIMVFLILAGEPLFRLLLTDKWLPAVPYFQILCIYGIVLPILQISYNLYKLYGESRLLLFTDIIRHFLVICSIFFTIKYGINYMLYGLVICTVIMTIFNLYKSGTLISLSLFDQLKRILPYYFTSTCVGILVYFLPNFDSDYFTICFSAGVFFFTYWGISKLMKFEGYLEVNSIINLFKGASLK